MSRRALAGVRPGAPYVAWKRCLHGSRRTRWPAQKRSMQMQQDCVRLFGSSSPASPALAEGAAPVAEAVPASRTLRLVITRSRKAGTWPPASGRPGLGIRHAGEIALRVAGVRVLGAIEESRPAHGHMGRATGRYGRRRPREHARMRRACKMGECITCAQNGRSGHTGHRCTSRGRARTAQRVVVFGGDFTMLQVHHQVVLRACKRNRKRASAPEMPFWATSRSRVSREARRGRGVRTVKRSTPAETAAASRSMER